MKLMFIVKLGTLLIFAACLSCCKGGKSRADEFHCKPMMVRGGWGYVVMMGSDTVVYQPYMPAVSSLRVFATEDDALKVGKIVCSKLQRGEAPSVNREEVYKALN